MRPIITHTIAAVMILLSSMVVSAQNPEQSVILEEGDSVAMAVLERYHIMMPELDNSRMIRAWRPHLYLLPAHQIGGYPHLWEQTMTQQTIVVKPPKILNYRSVTLRIGVSGRLTISNGSAFNYMPWSNYPGAYRDARTLSFPLPR